MLWWLMARRLWRWSWRGVQLWLSFRGRSLVLVGEVVEYDRSPDGYLPRPRVLWYHREEEEQ